MAFLRHLIAAVLLTLLVACAAPGAQSGADAAPAEAGGANAAAPAPSESDQGAQPPKPDKAPPMSAPLPPQRADDDAPAIDRSCRSDADCTVKNVGNCCGYYPACVNKDSPTDPAAVQAQCKASGMMSVCGFPDISSCSCNAGTCEAAGTGAAPAVQ